jgi:hypothetical protein
MASSKIPGPIGNDVHFANSDGKSWCDVGCHRGHTPGPIRVADAPKDKSKKTTKAPPVPTQVDTIIWHLYSTLIPAQSGYKGFSQQDFINWFQAPDDARIAELGKWSNEGINLEFKTDTKTGVKDFEKSLQRKGAIVVYIGHSTLTPTPPDTPEGPSLGLSPDNPKKGPEIPNATLRTWLGKSAASLVIIGSCDSKTAVGKIGAGPPIIVTNSGNDKLTLIDRMATAAATFLFLLIGWEIDAQRQPNTPHKNGHGTINEALAASAAAFTGMDDRFELVHGDGSIKLFP